MDTTNEKKVMLTDEDLDSVSGGKGSRCKHNSDIPIDRKYDFDDKDLWFEEIKCRTCDCHKIIKHDGSSKSIWIDWFTHDKLASWLSLNYKGHGLAKKTP